MPITDEHPVEGSDFKPLPEDVYQVVVQDVEAREGNKFQSEEKEFQYFFRLIVLDGDEDTKGQLLTMFASRKWFAGSKRATPSKLVNLVKAVYGLYYPKTDVFQLKAENMSSKAINDLIGKQLRVGVILNEDKTRNKVNNFLPAKKELKIPDGVELEDFPNKPEVKKKDEKKSTAKKGNDEMPWEGSE